MDTPKHSHIHYNVNDPRMPESPNFLCTNPECETFAEATPFPMGWGHHVPVYSDSDRWDGQAYCAECLPKAMDAALKGSDEDMSLSNRMDTIEWIHSHGEKE